MIYCQIIAFLLNQIINLNGVQNLMTFFSFKKQKSFSSAFENIWSKLRISSTVLDILALDSQAHAPPMRANLFWSKWNLTNHSNRMFVRGGISFNFIAGWSAAALGDT